MSGFFDKKKGCYTDNIVSMSNQLKVIHLSTWRLMILLILMSLKANAYDLEYCPTLCKGSPPTVKPDIKKNMFEESLVVEVYTESELLSLIRNNTHLSRIKKDQCQIVDDIKANAEVLLQPTFQFLWGEMLLNGVCVHRNIEYGMVWLRHSIRQGLPEAMLKMAHYYRNSRFVIPNYEKSVRLALASARSGNVDARILLVELYLAGHGYPGDYLSAYNMLYHSGFKTAKQNGQARKLLEQFANLLPPSQIYKIQNRSQDEF